MATCRKTLQENYWRAGGFSDDLQFSVGIRNMQKKELLPPVWRKVLRLRWEDDVEIILLIFSKWKHAKIAFGTKALPIEHGFVANSNKVWHSLNNWARSVSKCLEADFPTSCILLWISATSDILSRFNLSNRLFRSNCSESKASLNSFLSLSNFSSIWFLSLACFCRISSKSISRSSLALLILAWMSYRKIKNSHKTFKMEFLFLYVPYYVFKDFNYASLMKRKSLSNNYGSEQLHV